MIGPVLDRVKRLIRDLPVAAPFLADWPVGDDQRHCEPARLPVCDWLDRLDPPALTAGLVAALIVAAPQLQWRQTYTAADFGPVFLTGGYTTVIELSPDEKFLYYLPGAHGRAHQSGTPIVRYELATGQRTVLAFLADYCEREFDYVPGGTYGMKLSQDGRTIYVNFNGHAIKSARPKHLKTDGFGLTSFAAIHLPKSEMCP